MIHFMAFQCRPSTMHCAWVTKHFPPFIQLVKVGSGLHEEYCLRPWETSRLWAKPCSPCFSYSVAVPLRNRKSVPLERSIYSLLPDNTQERKEEQNRWHSMFLGGISSPKVRYLKAFKNRFLSGLVLSGVRFSNSQRPPPNAIFYIWTLS